MEIVSQRSEAEIDAEFAERRLRWALRELAANILRVRRGAGRSHDIGSQCLQVVECIKACHASKLVRLTALDLESMLRDDSTGESGHDSRARTDQEEARDVIVSGALQIEASRLDIPTHAASSRRKRDGEWRERAS